mmetsp:Transcript_8636/g.14545  ORF Transcript_8636/g.14545 Transcript_8636/m.14545 type:complete len:84 (+) Transcript_8636:85-336(+)
MYPFFLNQVYSLSIFRRLFLLSQSLLFYTHWRLFFSHLFVSFFLLCFLLFIVALWRGVCALARARTRVRVFEVWAWLGQRVGV